MTYRLIPCMIHTLQSHLYPMQARLQASKISESAFCCRRSEHFWDQRVDLMIPLKGPQQATISRNPQTQRITRSAARPSAPVRATTSSGTAASVPYGLAVYLQGIRDKLNLSLVIVSEDDPGKRTENFVLTGSRCTPWRRDDANEAGTLCETEIDLPEGFKPGVMLLRKIRDASSEQPPFVATIQLEGKPGSVALEYAAYTYIDIEQGERIIFPSTIAYPAFPNGHSPKGLESFRLEELKALRGTEEDRKHQRKGSERIYDYDVYNDLGDPEDEANRRPTLGGSYYKYPRRLRTGRKLVGPKKDEEAKPTKEDSSPAPGLPWLPLDETFNNEKNHAFSGDTNDTAGKVVRSILGTPRGYSFVLSLLPFVHKMFENKPQPGFESFSVVDALFDGLIGPEKKPTPLQEMLPIAQLKTIEILDLLEQAWKTMDGGLKKALHLDTDDGIFKAAMAEKKKEAEHHGGLLALLGEKLFNNWYVKAREGKEAQREKTSVASVEKESLGNRIADVVALIRGLLDKWPVPLVRQQRAMQWRSDEEFGRAALAGQNPFSIRAVTESDLKGSKVTDADLEALLEGKTLEQSLAKDRLWILDYSTGYPVFQEEICDMGDRVQYSGRCFMYTRNSGITVPVAIELETKSQPMRVFTPNDSAEVWFLAKLIIASLDSGIHQLVQHWLRTHACLEPYIIASRRQLSAMNPLYKLLEPHFRYTMRINCNARKVLINGGGIVEKAFTPGPYCMRLSSVAYDAWKFKEQSFPNDLVARGLASQGSDGKLKLKLPNYSYAEDGMLIWDAIYKFAGDYLSLHYKDDVEGQRVTDDVEIQAWWKEVIEKGHPDTNSADWPIINSVAALQDVAASIMWTSSCHHAAVNFGQYDNSAYMPYKPAKINRHIPAAGSPEEAALRDRFDENLLKTLSDPVSTIFVMITVKILSAHGTDEEYLDKEVHNYIKDEGGKMVHKKFVRALKEAEQEMEARNKSASRLRAGQGLPYTLLMPSKPLLQKFPDERPPARGIPYSTSI